MRLKPGLKPGMQTCVDDMSVEVIPHREKVVTSGGYIFKVQSFTFLPEKQEHWAGTVTGALEQVSEKNM